MTPQLAGILGIVALVVLIFLRIPVGISLIFVGFFGYVGIEGWARAATILGTTPFNIAGGYSLSVVPLFVLMARSLLQVACPQGSSRERAPSSGA